MTLADDNCRRCSEVTSLLSPMIFFSNVLKTLSYLCLHSKKKKERFQTVFGEGQGGAALTVKPNVIFLALARDSKSSSPKFVGVQRKRTHERSQCIPNLRFGPEEANSNLYWLIWRLQRPRSSRYASNIVHNLEWDSDYRVRKCQYPPHKNRRRKVERVNLRVPEEIKAGVESSCWQVTVNLMEEAYWSK